MDFNKELQNLKDSAKTKLSKEIYNTYEDAIEELKRKKIEDNALKVFDRAPDFTLKNQMSEDINLKNLLKEGNVVITFYRGGWCPYCNLELKGYIDIVPELKKLGTRLIAISPETPDNTMETIEKNNIDFDVLSDKDNIVAKKFGIVFKVSKEVAEIYESRNMSLFESQKNNENELPMPATFIIDRDGIIKLAFANADYKERLAPKDVLEKLKSL